MGVLLGVAAVAPPVVLKLEQLKRGPDCGSSSVSGDASKYQQMCLFFRPSIEVDLAVVVGSISTMIIASTLAIS